MDKQFNDPVEALCVCVCVCVCSINTSSSFLVLDQLWQLEA